MALKVKKWSEFQHYKHRNPPWIKLYKKYLDDMDFQCLPVASKALAPMLWLLASESDDGTIALTTQALAFRLRQTEKEIADAVSPLIAKGFFEEVDVASTTLASRLQVATTETETEKRQRQTMFETSLHKPGRWTGRDSDKPSEVAIIFLDRFVLSGDKVRGAVVAAVDQRMRITGNDAKACVESICSEYDCYLKSEPQFVRAPTTWLGECNQKFAEQTRPVMKWKPVEVSQ